MPLLVGDVERISFLQPANILSKKCKTSGLLLYHQQLPIDLKPLALVDSIVPLEVPRRIQSAEDQTVAMTHD